MTLLFSAVGTLQTAIECPTCGQTGKETMFTECCCKYALSLLGIRSTQMEMKCPLCGDDFSGSEDEIGCYKGYCSTYVIPTDLKSRFLRDEDGYCYAYENCTEEYCTHYLPYRKAFSNGCNTECQHHRLDGRCAA
jgi:ribosomal protein S27E